MRVRDWQDILADVTESNADPDGWRAIAGDRRDGVGEDLFFGHPDEGVYALKTYTKNPGELRGVGSRIARRIDDDLDRLFPRRDRDDTGRFGVQSPPEDDDHAETMATRLEEAVKVHSEAPTDPDDFFTDVMDALDSPAFGPMEYEFDGRPDRLDELSAEFADAEELLSADLDRLVEEDGVGRGFQ